MKITQKYMTKSYCYKANQKITPKGIVLHSVGINQPSAEVFQRLFNDPKLEKSMHGFIDATTGEIIETLPQNINGWHVGGSANKTHLGFEMCEPSQIKYTTGASFTVSNLSAAQKAAKTTYNAAVEYFASLCKKYGWDPTKKGVILSHSEAGAQGVGSKHVDPEHLWKGLKLSYTMDGFRKDVKAKMNESIKTETTVKPDDKVIYRVQIGAFTSKENAKAYVEKAKAKGFAAIYTIDGDINNDGKVDKKDVDALSKKIS